MLNYFNDIELLQSYELLHSRLAVVITNGALCKTDDLYLVKTKKKMMPSEI